MDSQIHIRTAGCAEGGEMINIEKIICDTCKKEIQKGDGYYRLGVDIIRCSECYKKEQSDNAKNI